MLISVDWLREFVTTDKPVDELSHMLTMLGLEIEGREDVGGDTVLEVNVTPNRPDCLSVLGIAREVAAATGIPLTMPPHEVRDAGPSPFRVEIQDSELCPRYAGRVIKGVSIGPSPSWISERLEKMGVRSINNIVDITNYVLLELGHPLHAFDLATLGDATIRVGVAGDGNSITTLDGAERRLPKEALLIWDAARPVAIAGVMGGADTEVSGGTCDVFLESAYFKPESVRRTSKGLGLSTEASYRFERGTDIVMLEHALDRAALLMAEVAGGTVYGIVDEYPRKLDAITLKVSANRVNALIGTDIPAAEMTSMLDRLGLSATLNGDEITVTPPPCRRDITMPADIVEEVIRFHGYDKAPTVLPKATILPPISNVRLKELDRIKSVLLKDGYSEAINYSFMNIQMLDKLGIPASDMRRRCVEVRNPLRSEDAHMRTTLAASLMENFQYNFARGARKVRLFEMAKVFIAREGAKLPDEPMRVGGIMYEDPVRLLYKQPAEAFYIAKGTVESLLATLRLRGASYAPSKEPFLHPGKSADIALAGKSIGYLGVINPACLTRLDIKVKHEVVLFELDLDALLTLAPLKAGHVTVPRFPAVERDVALILPDAARVSDVLGAIGSYGCAFIEEASVFDHFRGGNVPAGKKSLAFNIRYRSNDRTLTVQEVEDMHSGLVKHLLEKVSAEARTS